MRTTDWLDRIAADLLLAEAETRAALRRLRPGAARHQHTPTAPFGRSVQLAEHEARALLRGVMPAPIATTSLRPQHASIMAALHHLAAHMQALNDPCRDPAVPLRVACRLIDELSEWIRQTRWNHACRTAGIRGWKCPTQIAIRPVLELQTYAVGEQIGDAAQGLRAHPSAGLRALAAMRALSTQDELALPLPHPVDRRQLALPLFNTAA